MRNRHVRSTRIFRSPPQDSLFPSVLEDEIPADHFVRHLRSLVEQMASGLRLAYDDKGGVAYDPVGLLCVLLYGFMQGTSSSRVLEELCRYDSRFKFLTRGLRPDHNTISRFRRRLETELPEIFTGVLCLAREQGLLGMKVVAVDGTKIEGNVGQWKKLVRQANEEEAPPASDPDARFIRDRRKGIVRGYNAQIAVDEERGMIVGYEVSNQAKDTAEMPPILAAMERSTGELPEVVVADAGYDSAINHAALDECGVKGFICPPASYDAFWSVGESGQVVCPSGHAAVLSRKKLCSNGLYDVYTVRQCSTCPLRAKCSPRRLKSLSVKNGASVALRVMNARRAFSPEGEELLRKRQRIVEPVFGHMKANRGLRRFKLRTRDKVRIELGLACLAHNLEKLIRALLCLLTPIQAIQMAWIYRFTALRQLNATIAGR